MGYPRALGLPELREAIAAWVQPALRCRAGSRAGGHPDARLEGGDLQLRPGRARPRCRPRHRRRHRARLPRRRARHALRGRRGRPSAPARGTGFLPDLDAVDPAVWRRAAVVWTQLSRTTRPASRRRASFYERLAALAAEHDFLVASDEAYSELWFDGDAPVSALQVDDRSRVVVFNSLSKRSSMTGYRSGFVAAPPDVIDALRVFRPTVGTAPQEFVQRAAVAAWSDEEHVAEARERYRRKRAVLMQALARKGCRVAGSVATMYLWVEIPGRVLGGVRPPLARARPRRGAGRLPRALGRGVRPVRARPHGGGVRGGRGDHRGGALTVDVARPRDRPALGPSRGGGRPRGRRGRRGDSPARSWRGARGGEARRRAGSSTSGRRRRSSCRSASSRPGRSRSARTATSTRFR